VNEGLRQFEDNRYEEAWEGEGKKVFKIVVKFDSKKMTIVDWTAKCGKDVVAKMQKSDADTQSAQNTDVDGPETTTRNKMTVARAARTVRSPKLPKIQGLKAKKDEQTTERQHKTHSDGANRPDQSTQTTPAAVQSMGRSKKAEKVDMQQLLAKAREEGVRSSLSMLLEQRFGTLPDLAQDMLGHAPLQKLGEWMGKFGKSTELFEVFLAPDTELTSSGEREEWARSMLLILLKQRFVTLPDLAKDIVSNAPLQKLGEWTEKVLKASDLFEIFL
jgi:hypothetical protein